MNKASKYWQENFEDKIDTLENTNFHRYVKKPDGGYSYSPTKIIICISEITFLCFVLFTYKLMMKTVGTEFDIEYLNKKDTEVIIFITISLFLLFIFSIVESLLNIDIYKEKSSVKYFLNKLTPCYLKVFLFLITIFLICICNDIKIIIFLILLFMFCIIDLLLIKKNRLRFFLRSISLWILVYCILDLLYDDRFITIIEMLFDNRFRIIISDYKKYFNEVHLISFFFLIYFFESIQSHRTKKDDKDEDCVDDRFFIKRIPYDKE